MRLCYAYTICCVFYIFDIKFALTFSGGETPCIEKERERVIECQSSSLSKYRKRNTYHK